MAVSKANQRAVNKYVKANYDRINVTMPKGEKEIIQEYAAAYGESVNGFIVRSIRERMERNSGGTASEIAQQAAETTQGAGVVSLPPDTLKAAQRAAGRTGESVSAFVARAVVEQDKRDDNSIKIGINPA